MIKLVMSIILSSLLGTILGVGIHVYGSDNSFDDIDIYLKHVDEFTYLANITTDNSSNKNIPEKSKDITKHQSEIIHADNLTSYRHIISSNSKKYKVESSLVYAIIKVESNWNPKAISKKGAKGLMQLMPSTANDMNVMNLFDPEENIKGGIRYLRFLLDKFNGDISLALAAYNSGPTKVERFNGIPPIKETKQYVKRVLSIYNNKRTL
jgi:soluble lytic murein transglycosylase-like protein